MFGLLAVAGDMGCALGPFLTGQVSGFSQSLPVAAELCQSFGITLEQFGLKAGLAAALLFPILLVVGVLCFKRQKRLWTRKSSGRLFLVPARRGQRRNR